MLILPDRGLPAGCEPNFSSSHHCSPIRLGKATRGPLRRHIPCVREKQKHFSTGIGKCSTRGTEAPDGGSTRSSRLGAEVTAHRSDSVFQLVSPTPMHWHEQAPSWIQGRVAGAQTHTSFTPSHEVVPPQPTTAPGPYPESSRPCAPLQVVGEMSELSCGSIR